jgi:gliding motility-associated lipoprotein GldD
MKKRHSISILLFLILFAACNETYSPKPRGYFRIDLPEHEYIAFDTAFPYSFEYPLYAEINPDPFSPEEPYWLNIDFPDFKGRIHISYKTVDGNLFEYFEDSWQFVMKHIPKASAINDSLILDRERELYGLVYHIDGMGAASPCQFFITDSTQHFIRGALYFDVVPNNDSLAPVINFLKKDIEHLLSSFHWK